MTNPPSAVPPVLNTNTLVLDAKGQPTIGTTGQIATVTVAAAGASYTVGDTLTVVQSGAINALIRVLTVTAGAVATVAVINGGQGYSAAAGLATSGGTGTGCTITIATITAGFHLGLSEGPTSSTLTPKFELIKADQWAAPVAAAFTSNTGEMDFTIKEFTLVSLQRYFAGLYSATNWALSAGSTNPACSLLQVGSSYPSTAKTTSVLFVTPDRAVQNRFSYFLGYRCYIESTLQMPINRSKEMLIKIKMGMLLDTTRTAGDMAGQWIRQT